MELLIAILIAFGFVNATDSERLSQKDAISIFNENKLDDKAKAWAEENETSIWEEEAGDFIWEEEAGNF